MYIDNLKLRSLIRTDWFVWVAFFCCPVLAMPMVINGCYRQKKNMYLLFSLFMGLCAMLLYPPVADLYRHWVNFQDIKLFEWNDFLFFLGVNIKVDFLLPLLEFIFIKYGVSFGFLRFLLVASTTMLFLNAYNSYCKSMKPNDRDRCVFLWFVIFIIPYAAVAVGLRSSFAASLVSYYIFRHYVLNEKRFIDIGLLLIAFFFHFGVMMVIPLILLAEVGLYVRHKPIFYLVFGILFFVSQSFGLLVSVLPLGELNDYLVSYTEGEYASTEYLEGHNIFFWLPTIGHYTCNILFFAIFCKNVPITKQTSLVYNLFLLTAFTSAFFAVNGRVMAYFYYYGIFFLMKYAGMSKLKVLFKTYVFLTLFGFMLEWRKHTITRWYYLFSPYPVALSMDYDDNWVMNNVNPNGELYIYIK